MDNRPSFVDMNIRTLGNGSPEEMQKLRDYVDNCPACILAAIRQSPYLDKSYGCEKEDFAHLAWISFDFEAESKDFWEAINEEKRANGDY